MKRTLSCSLILVLILSATSVLAASNWWEVGPGSASGGGISNNDGMSRYPSLALDGQGYPAVAWGDDAGGEWQIYVKRWDGSSWVGVGTGSASGGGISNDSERSMNPTVVVDSAGNPIVGWPNHIKRWDGSTWVDLCSGQTCLRLVNERTNTLAIDQNDNLFALCGKDEMGLPVVVKRWDGSTWTQLGEFDYGHFLTLAVSDSGTPFAVWAHNCYGEGGGKIYLKQWNGSQWIELGGSASGDGIVNTGEFCLRPHLAVNSAGNPVVAWNDAYGGHVVQWTGSAWVEFGNGWSRSAPGTVNSVESMALDSLNNPVVVGSVPSFDGSLYPYDIGVMKWNGSGWDDMGDGSSSAGGVSYDIYMSTSPSIAIADDGRAFVAWRSYDEETMANFQIFVKKYDPIYDIPNCAISINNGALYTGQLDVQICSTTSDAAQMLVSNDAGFTGAHWQPYEPTLSWMLANPGERIVTLVVYVRFRDAYGSLMCAGTTLSDDIIYDSLSPTVELTIMEIAPALSAKVIAQETNVVVTLQLNAADQEGGSGVAEMQISTSGSFAGAKWQPFSTTAQVTARRGETVYVRVRDGVGNVSPVASSLIAYWIYLPLVLR